LDGIFDTGRERIERAICDVLSFPITGNTLAQNTDCSTFIPISSKVINLYSQRYTYILYDVCAHNKAFAPGAGIGPEFSVGLCDINTPWTTPSRTTASSKWKKPGGATGVGLSHGLYYGITVARNQILDSSGTYSTLSYYPLQCDDPTNNNYTGTGAMGNLFFDWFSSQHDASGSYGALNGRPWSTICMVCDNVDKIAYYLIRNTKPNNGPNEWLTYFQQPFLLTGVLQYLNISIASFYIGNFRWSQSN